MPPLRPGGAPGLTPPIPPGLPSLADYEPLAREHIGGALGVAHVLKILRSELEIAMALTGCASPEAIDRSLIRE